MTKGQSQIALSAEAKEEIEQIVRDVVREELAALNKPTDSIVEDILDDVKAENELARLEDKKENADQLIRMSLRIASSAQAWLRKPAAFGGPATANGGRATNFKGLSLTLEQLGYPINPNGIYENIHGHFEMEIQEGSEILTIYARNEVHRNQVKVEVAGMLASDINTVIQGLP